MELRNKTILITGGAGFIGSHLCEKLAEENTVYSLDNYFTGSENNHVRNVHYLKGNTKDINSIIKFKPDILFHLGEYSRVEQSFIDIEKVYEYNTISIIQILEFVRKTNCKLIYAGSSTKYGDNGETKDSSPYAWSKATNTNLIVNYSEWYNINYAIVYFYNVYGGREICEGRYATLIGLFTALFKQNKPLTVVSPGTQKRNFTHIEDIVSGLIVVAEKGNGDEFGIGCEESFSVLEVAKMFKAKIEMIPERKGNRMDAKVISDRTKSLGWNPRFSLKDFIDDLQR